MENWNAGDLPVKGYKWLSKQPIGSVLLSHSQNEYLERYVTKHNRLIPRLQEAGFHVYGIDLRGHGASSGERGTVDIVAAVQDYAVARRRLKHEQPDLPMFFLGQGLGAMCLTHSALEEPQGVAGVVSLSLPVQPGAQVGAALKAVAPLMSRFIPNAQTMALQTQYISRLSQEVRDYENDERVFQGGMRMKTGISIVTLGDKTWAERSNWKTPILGIYGDGNPLINAEGLRHFFADLPVQDKHLECIKGGYDQLLNDKDKDRVLEIILDWLQQRAAPTSQAQAVLLQREERMRRLRERAAKEVSTTDG